MTFKEINWQMIRIEADAIQSSKHEMMSAPVRLITNQSKIRVTLKRRVNLKSLKSYFIFEFVTRALKAYMHIATILNLGRNQCRIP